MAVAEADGLFKSPLLLLLLRIVLFERQALTAEALADRAGAPYPTVTREIRRLERLGLVTSSTVGRTKLLTADRADSTVRALARFLVAAGLGPLPAPAPEGGDDMAKKKDKKKSKKKKK